MNDASSQIPLINSVSGLAEQYDVWLCDIWGVMHNGLRPFPTASHAGEYFRSRGGTVILISNSPRPREGVIEQLSAIGVARGAWDGVTTSGDVTRDLIAQNQGRPILHLGPERDRGVFEGLEVAFADAEGAELIVCSGLYDDLNETPDDYEEVLGDLVQRGLPMICANPDLMVERGEKLIYCAGALAQAYEKLGGKVVYAGKPHRPLYEMALGLAGEMRGYPIDPGRVLAIGDGLKTDMAGAAAAGLDALFVASGLHLEQAGSDGSATAEEIAGLFTKMNMRPVAAQARLSW